MKCANCGAELRVGCVYCSVCGKEAQIVPDYNLEDDFLVALVNEDENKNKKIIEDNQTERQKAKKMSKKKLRIYTVLITVGVCLIIFVTGFVGMRLDTYENDIQKAQKAYKQQKYERAMQYAEDAQAKDKKAPESYAIIGASYYHLQEYEAAITQLTKAIEYDHANKLACKYLILSYAKLEDYQAIQALYQQIDKKQLAELFIDYLVATPVVRPIGGHYPNKQELELESYKDEEIYYTIDGSNPKTNGILYTEVITMESGNTTLRAVCKDERGVYSEIIKEEYEIEETVPDLPTASPESGTYTQPTQITIAVPEGCTAYYAWNAIPDTNATVYTGPIDMPEGNNVLAILVMNSEGQTSAIQKYNYVYMP